MSPACPICGNCTWNCRCVPEKQGVAKEMSLVFKPEDFELENPAIAKYISCERAAEYANAKRDQEMESLKKANREAIDAIKVLQGLMAEVTPAMEEAARILNILIMGPSTNEHWHTMEHAKAWLHKYGEKR